MFHRHSEWFAFVVVAVVVDKFALELDIVDMGIDGMDAFEMSLAVDKYFPDTLYVAVHFQHMDVVVWNLVVFVVVEKIPVAVVHKFYSYPIDFHVYLI